MSHQRPFSKRQVQEIIKIVFLESMLIVLIIPSLQSTGEIPPTFPCDGLFHTGFGRCESGSASCIVNNVICSVSTTFTTPFTHTPRITLTPTISATSAMIENNIFFNTANVTWNNFPVATTEFLGGTFHRIEVFAPGTIGPKITELRFCVEISAISASATAFLQIQFTNIDIQPTVWQSTPTALDINVGSAVSIADGNNLACSAGSANSPVVIPGSMIFPDAIFRVVGVGGTGAGDSITVGSVSLEVFYSIDDIFACNQGLTSLTSFAMIGAATLGTGTVTCKWVATNDLG